MDRMKAAVVTSFSEPPHYLPFDVPRPETGTEMLVDVLAAGLHPRVRSGAAGVHYTSTGALPMIPGIDAVGRRPDGKRIYFVAGDDAPGTMADKAVADVRRAIELPDGVNVVKVAAAMNPAMSSWVALRLRVPIQPGQSVLVLGVTGNAGGMAVQVAKRLGAGRVVGAGRDLDRLSAVAAAGADEVIPLTADDQATGTALAAAAVEADIVLDYLWGKPAQQAIVALLTARSDRSRAMNWIQIGSVGWPDDRAALSRPALGESPRTGQRPGRSAGAGIPRRTAVAGGRDRLRRDRGHRQPCAPRRCGGRLDPDRPAGRAHRPRPMSSLFPGSGAMQRGQGQRRV
jgi:hypothetical protein